MGAVQEQEHRLLQGGCATASTINKVLHALEAIQVVRGDDQALLEKLKTAATPENVNKAIELNRDQLAYLTQIGLTDGSGHLKNQRMAMVLASAIHFTEGQYGVFAPIA